MVLVLLVNAKHDTVAVNLLCSKLHSNLEVTSAGSMRSVSQHLSNRLFNHYFGCTIVHPDSSPLTDTAHIFYSFTVAVKY